MKILNQNLKLVLLHDPSIGFFKLLENRFLASGSGKFQDGAVDG
jgi:hypothetical protein